jgi:hypothetical protein
LTPLRAQQVALDVQGQAGDVGEALGLHQLLEAAAHRALDAVEDRPPQRLACHARPPLLADAPALPRQRG